MIKRVALTAGSIALMTASAFVSAHAADPANAVTMQLSTGGPVVLELRPDIAPKHAERIRQLAGEGFYNGMTFHRVIEGFMAQTGDPTGTGAGGSKYPDLAAEFSDAEYVRGTVGMARKSDPNSANSQFFICFDDQGCATLKGQYTVVGKVTSGMEFVDKLARGEPPASPDKIEKMEASAAAAPAESAPHAAAAPAAEPSEHAPSDAGAAPDPAPAPTEAHEPASGDDHAGEEVPDSGSHH